MYYRPCPICGAHLDPGETCDCRGKKDTALGVATTEDGKGVTPMLLKYQI